MKDLLNHLIEENHRLNERLKAVGSKSVNRKKQLRKLYKGIIKSNNNTKLLEAAVEARSYQLNVYAQELQMETRSNKEQEYELLKERDALGDMIESLKVSLDNEIENNQLLKLEIEKLKEPSFIEKFFDLFNRKKEVT